MIEIDYQATGQLLIAAIVAYVAIQNYKVNKATQRVQKNKLRLDLFDRRLRVFEACQNLISFIVMKGVSTREENFEFSKNSSEAEFLFGKEIELYVKEMSQKSLKLIHTRERLVNNVFKSEVERLELIENDEELFKWFMEQYENSRNLFRKYLHFSIDKKA